ncbi:MAG: hypothetical protein IMZ57_02255 [Acidobacteria bacterium]|nr:hypothetical protein [Acidobacteriota bacterium]
MAKVKLSNAALLARVIDDMDRVAIACDRRGRGGPSNSLHQQTRKDLAEVLTRMGTPTQTTDLVIGGIYQGEWELLADGVF